MSSPLKEKLNADMAGDDVVVFRARGRFSCSRQARLEISLLIVVDFRVLTHQ